ncbi:MAG: LuxR C-terminal-related transcriptional regulator [Blastocatellia bacterium]
MNRNDNCSSSQFPSVLIFASELLVTQCLKVLLENIRDLTVLGVANTFEGLNASIAGEKPNVILVYVGEDDRGKVDFVRTVAKASPTSKIVLLVSPENKLDQTSALKAGVTGILTTNQGAKVLSRAIQQVASGEVWLNQKLIEQLIGVNGQRSEKQEFGRPYTTEGLTKREIDVVRLVAIGLNNKNISKNLNISEATVRHHLSSVYSKLHIDDRLNLAIYAFQMKIVEPSAAK